MARTTPQKSVAKPASASTGATPATKPATPSPRALVVGVSGYPAPLNKLPGVAADVREVGKVLTSRRGTFPLEGVAALTEKNATREGVLASLKKVFAGAKADDTIFVYLAGHGAVEAQAYYYVAYDSKRDRLAETGVPLADIKRLFDRTKCRRVFLWLDFCHSGGMTERGTVGSDVSAISREIGVVQGSGKVIVAACTSGQFAYEDPQIGHGLFTHALLRGLKGEAKSAQGEVTALSLYEFIDHQVKRPDQQPTFHGQMSGRIVLAYYPAPGAAKPTQAVATKPAPAKATSTSKAAVSVAAGRIASSGNLLLLDGRIYATLGIKDIGNDKVEARILVRDGAEDTALRSLRGDRFHHKSVSVVFGNQAFNGRVEDAPFELTGSKSVCTATIRPEAKSDHYSVNTGYNAVTPEQMAEMRARILLLDEKPSVWEGARDNLLQSFVMGPLKDAGIHGGIFPVLYRDWKGTQADFLRAARLWALYYLKSSSTCDDILELALGPLRGGMVSVALRGYRRSQYSNPPSHEIVVKGRCALSK